SAGVGVTGSGGGGKVTTSFGVSGSVTFMVCGGATADVSAPLADGKLFRNCSKLMTSSRPRASTTQTAVQSTTPTAMASAVTRMLLFPRRAKCLRTFGNVSATGLYIERPRSSAKTPSKTSSPCDVQSGQGCGTGNSVDLSEG